MKCLAESGLAQTLLQPLVLPLTVVHATSGSLRQLASELLNQLTRQQSSDDTAKQAVNTTLAPTSTTEFYSELCATAELFCQLSRCVLCLYSYTCCISIVLTCWAGVQHRNRLG